MDIKKFEQLSELIINENEEQARALFHDIVVEKSREIYETIIAEEMEDEGLGGQVGDLLDEISAEESGVVEGDEEEFDIEADDDGDEEMVDFEASDDEEMSDEGDLEDRVVDLEDKLDQLMAEFEEIMGNEEDMGDEEMSDEEDMGDEEMSDEEDMGDEEDTLEESITLKKVAVTHGDNGQNTKSTVAANSGAKGMASKPVQFVDGTEAVPSSPKKPTNAYAKGETQVKHASQWKNAPAQTGQDLEKAPAPKKGDDGANTKSPLGESRKTAKKRI